MTIQEEFEDYKLAVYKGPEQMPRGQELQLRAVFFGGGAVGAARYRIFPAFFALEMSTYLTEMNNHLKDGGKLK